MKIPDDEASNISPEEFERERTRIKEIFTEISSENKPIKTSPLLGPLTKDEWGTLCYVHENNQFKQFGV